MRKDEPFSIILLGDKEHLLLLQLICTLFFSHFYVHFLHLLLLIFLLFSKIFFSLVYIRQLEVTKAEINAFKNYSKFFHFTIFISNKPWYIGSSVGRVSEDLKVGMYLVQSLVVVPFIFRIFSSFMKHYITRAQGPVIVIAKKFKLWSSIY